MSNTVSYPLCEVPVEVTETLKMLRGHNAHAYLAGGALRDIILGKEPNDYDVFIVSESPDETDALHEALVLSGYEQQHSASYDAEGYLADYRKGDVNVVIYANTLYSNIVELVQSFDLNINMYLYDDLEEMEIQNVVGWDITKPVRVHNRSKSTIVQYRVSKFQHKFPNLDWSQV